MRYSSRTHFSPSDAWHTCSPAQLRPCLPSLSCVYGLLPACAYCPSLMLRLNWTYPLHNPKVPAKITPIHKNSAYIYARKTARCPVTLNYSRRFRNQDDCSENHNLHTINQNCSDKHTWRGAGLMRPENFWWVFVRGCRVVCAFPTPTLCKLFAPPWALGRFWKLSAAP